MAFTGDLRSLSLVDILQVIHGDKKSGVLLIEWKDLTIAYYVKNGQLIFARPVDRVFRVYADRDFDLLLEKLRIAKEHAFKTVERFFIDRLNLKEGVFSFIPGFVRFGSDDYVVKYTTEELIMTASRNLTQEEVERKISEIGLVFEQTEDARSIIPSGLTEAEMKVLELTDGQRTVGDIRRDSGLDSLTVDRALYGLLAVGAIKRKRRERRQRQSIALELLMKIIERIRGL